MHHSDQVASKHYDRDLPNLKANVVVYLAGCSNSNQLTAEDIPECVAKKRKIRDEEDRAAAQAAGKERLRKESKISNPAKRRTSQWSLTPDEREIFQKVLSDVDNQESCAAIFQLEAGEDLLPSGSDTEGAPPRKFPTGKRSRSELSLRSLTSFSTGNRWQRLLYRLLDSLKEEGSVNTKRTSPKG